jgi:hypothetical protein
MFLQDNSILRQLLEKRLFISCLRWVANRECEDILREDTVTISSRQLNWNIASISGGD